MADFAKSAINVVGRFEADMRQISRLVLGISITCLNIGRPMMKFTGFIPNAKNQYSKIQN